MKPKVKVMEMVAVLIKGLQYPCDAGRTGRDQDFENCGEKNEEEKSSIVGTQPGITRVENF